MRTNLNCGISGGILVAKGPLLGLQPNMSLLKQTSTSCYTSKNSYYTVAIFTYIMNETCKPIIRENYCLLRFISNTEKHLFLCKIHVSFMNIGFR